jgi:hypothetical protein
MSAELSASELEISKLIAAWFQHSLFAQNADAYKSDASAELINGEEVVSRRAFRTQPIRPVTLCSADFANLLALNTLIKKAVVVFDIPACEYVLYVSTTREHARLSGVPAAATALLTAASVPDMCAGGEWTYARQKVDNDAQGSLCVCVGAHVLASLCELMGIPSASEALNALSSVAVDVFNRHGAPHLIVQGRVTVDSDRASAYKVTEALFQHYGSISHLHVDRVEVVTEAINATTQKVSVNVYINRIGDNERQDWHPRYTDPFATALGICGVSERERQNKRKRKRREETTDSSREDGVNPQNAWQDRVFEPASATSVNAEEHRRRRRRHRQHC